MFCFLKDLKQNQSLPLGTCEYRAPASEFSLHLLFVLGLLSIYEHLLSNASLPPPQLFK